MKSDVLDIVTYRLSGKTNDPMLIQQAVDEAEERIRTYTNRHCKPLPHTLKMTWARLATEIALDNVSAFSDDNNGSGSTDGGEIKKITEGGTTIEFASGGSVSGTSSGGLGSESKTWQERYAPLLEPHRVLAGEE